MFSILKGPPVGTLAAGPDSAPELAGKAGFSNTSGRTSTSTLQPSKATLSLLVFGQSNAVSIASDVSFVPLQGVDNFNPYDSKTYVAKDPILGAETAGGSVLGVAGASWSIRLASLMVGAGFAERVVVCNVAIGATMLSDWSAGGRLDGRLRFAIRAMQQAGLAPDFILQMQGESDAFANTPSTTYASTARAIVSECRRNGSSAPYFVAQTTLISGATIGGRDGVRQGQIDACSAPLGIFQGPDCDVLVGPNRQADGTHLTDMGIANHAAQWVSVLQSWMAGSS